MPAATREGELFAEKKTSYDDAPGDAFQVSSTEVACTCAPSAGSMASNGVAAHVADVVNAATVEPADDGEAQNESPFATTFQKYFVAGCRFAGVNDVSLTSLATILTGGEPGSSSTS